MSQPRNTWFVLTLLLLFVVGSRMIRISDFDLDAHENLAIFRSNGTPQEILERIPYDWGPLWFLTLGGWQALAGSHPVPLRFLSVLLFTFGSASVFALMRRLVGRGASLAVLLYAAPTALILLSLFTRGYALLIALLPFALYMGLRYAEKPSWLTGATLTLTLTLMVYIHVTGGIAIIMFGLFMLLRGGLPMIRRFLPVVFAFILLIMPELLSKKGAASSRASSIAWGMNSLQLQELFTFFVGTPVLGVLWLVVIIVAVIGLVYGRASRSAWLLVLWSVLGFGIAFMLGGLIGSPRHSWWYLLPTALWITWGISLLPRPVHVGAGVVAAAIALAPMQLNWIDDSALVNPPLYENLEWLTHNIRWGDVLVIDPNTTCAPFQDEWDNALHTYFPNGLRVVSDPAGYARVWYAATENREDTSLRESVLSGRLASIFVGPSECLLRLYVGPPDSEGIAFENGLRFHGAEVIHEDELLISPVVLNEKESLRLRLWWSVDRPLEADYSIGAHLYDEQDRLVTQHDAAPQLVSLSPVAAAEQREMIAWQPDQFYVEERTIEIPALGRSANGLRKLNLMLVVYQWWDGERIAAPGIDDDLRLLLLPVQVRFF